MDFYSRALFDRLDASIEEASINKKILASRLNRIISLKREVELKEKAAEEAKEEAATSSSVILARVEALKQAQQLIRETNDMHAREVYAQQAILAKDVKELQNRMSGVLNQSLVVSDEMHRVLKMRLAKAVRDKDLADKQKLEKERLALEALAYEESQMLKLVKESKRLKQEALENSKLQDCFKERESVVDILLGDVSDKYQNINLLIEHLDQPILQLRGNMNGSFEVKSAPVVAEISKVGHSVSTKSSVAAPLTLKSDVKVWKRKEKRIACAGEIYRG